jgi:hypothetical protein
MAAGRSGRRNAGGVTKNTVALPRRVGEVYKVPVARSLS